MPAGKGASANYGWRLRKGAVATPKAGVSGEAPQGAIEPIYVYGHGMGPAQGLSVTRGYVYRGPILELQGRYVFADYQNPRIWSFRAESGHAVDLQDHTAALQQPGGRIGFAGKISRTDR